MASPLKHFALAPGEGGYQLTFETDDGTRFETTASYEQLDLIAEAIDGQLDADEEEELVEDEKS